jgi:hypothetical protein
LTRAATGVFCALVAATFAAFFVAQRLKNEPSDVKGFRALAAISPNGDGHRDRTPISFFLKKTDDVSVDIVDDKRALVRSLVEDRHLTPRQRIRGVVWNGRDDEAQVVPDGIYSVRVTLRREGRAVFPARVITVDDTPPRPRVVSIGPVNGVSAPEYLPNNRDGGVQIKVVAAGVDRKLLIFRTDVRPFRLVRTLALGPEGNERDWDGTDDAGRNVPDGTYAVVAQARDHAGNVGSIPPLDGSGRPAFSYGTHFGGRGGVTVRHIAVQPPFIPPRAGTLMHALVDARGKPYRWSIRRLGAGVIRGRGRKTKFALNVHAPRGSSGLYLLSATRAGHTTTVPVPVQGRGHQPVLVVLPYMTWQGRNPVDDDGDGMPNMLDLGVGVRGARPFAGSGLPAGFLHAEAPVISWLDHTHRRYDITTDLALALGQGPKLEGHSGVLIPGDARWITRRLGGQLREFVRSGGVLVSLGTGSLQRRVRISPSGRLYAPTPASATDLFGAVLRPLQRGPVTVQSFTDHLQLFAQTNGTFGPLRSYEETRRVGREADLESVAVTASGAPLGRQVIVAVSYGKGTVIRTGLPEFPDRLSAPGQISTLMERIWTLLSH